MNRVRHAEPGDRFRVIRLLKEAQPGAVAASGVEFAFSAPHAEQLFFAHQGRPNACCLLLNECDGLLMARTFDHPFGAGKWASETCWYIRPEARGTGAIRMLRAYETWAREAGCRVIGMVSMANNDVGAIYRRLGFQPVETNYAKVL